MLPLEGIVVLDLTRGYPGAYTCMCLGDFGAEVLRVDPPPGARGNDRADMFEVGERPAAFKAANRNKKSMILNLRSSEGKEVFYRLAKRADVLVEGFRPGAMKRLEADYDTLKELNPRLVYCSLTGYGSSGPYATFPGHEPNYDGIAGALSLIGPRNGPPVFPSNYLADMAGAALHGTIGVLLALQARERTGQGQWVDMAYLDGVMSLMANDISNYFLSGQVPRRGETRGTGADTDTQIYRCKDGEYFTVSCGEAHFWETFCRLLERPDLIPVQRATGEERERVVSQLQEVFLTRTRDEWTEFFRGKEVCVGPVLYLNETVQHPQVQHRQMVVEVEHPRLGTVKQMGIPIKLSATPGSIRSLGVPIGTHSEELMGWLGYSSEELKGLRERGVVQ